MKLKDICERSTRVVAWYAHSYDGTVRGPFCRWFKCSDVDEQYRKHVASIDDEVNFCATAMNKLPVLVMLLEEVRDELRGCGDTCSQRVAERITKVLEEEIE